MPVALAHARRLHLDPHLARLGRIELTVDDLQWLVGLEQNGGLHGISSGFGGQLYPSRSRCLPGFAAPSAHDLACDVALDIARRPVEQGHHGATRAFGVAAPNRLEDRTVQGHRRRWRTRMARGDIDEDAECRLD